MRKCILTLAFVITGSAAFTPLQKVSKQRGNVQRLAVTQTPDNSELSRRGLVQFFGIAAFWIASQQNSLAASPSSDPGPFFSSSVQVSDAVKTLDMSLPVYGDIKSPKASIENVESLSIKSSPSTAVGVSKSRKKTGIPMSSVLPSMGKKSAKDKKEEKEKRASEGLEYNF